MIIDRSPVAGRVFPDFLSVNIMVKNTKVLTPQKTPQKLKTPQKTPQKTVKPVLKDEKLSKVNLELLKQQKENEPKTQYCKLSFKDAERITPRDLVSQKIMDKRWMPMGTEASKRCLERISSGAEAPVSQDDFFLTFGPMVAFKYQATKHLRKDWRHAIVCQRSLA